MGFDVQLEPGTWKGLVKGVLREEVFGRGKMTVDGLLREAEERQQRWHGRAGAEEGRRLWGAECEGDGEARACESLGAERIRMAMGRLDWD
jgi:hypothetical protein